MGGAEVRVGFAEPVGGERLLHYLIRHRMLGRLAPAELQRLIMSAKPVELVARRRLFAAGQPASAVYVVLSGWIKLSRGASNGRDVVLELAGEGCVFGELGVISGAPRGADAIALSECQVLAMEGAVLLDILRINPAALFEMTKILCERLTRANAQLEDSLLAGAEMRLARGLMRLAAQSATRSGRGLLIDLGLSQKDIGEMTGLTRESTNKHLGAWRDAGLISLSGRTLTLIDCVALKEIAEGA